MTHTPKLSPCRTCDSARGCVEMESITGGGAVNHIEMMQMTCALPVMPKRNLADDVAQWVAAGGVITVVKRETIIEKVGQQDQIQVLTLQRKDRGEKSRLAVLNAVDKLGRATSAEINDLVDVSMPRIFVHLARLMELGLVKKTRYDTYVYYERNTKKQGERA